MNVSSLDWSVIVGDTREKILQTALSAFSREGFEAVSVSQIAGALGMTKSALYKHYASKRDIFESILTRMQEADASFASAFALPGESFSLSAESYEGVAFQNLRAFSTALFEHWTLDEFSCAFRRMLSLERYRSGEMARLYAQYLSRGPLEYTENIFFGMGFPLERARALALRFYSPIYFLYSLSDDMEDKSEALEMLKRHFDDFEREVMGE